jgi:hypothetical protein
MSGPVWASWSATGLGLVVALLLSAAPAALVVAASVGGGLALVAGAVARPLGGADGNR